MENEKQRDRISECPDELLLKILSGLPSKDMVATSVLSKRWRFLWKDMKTFRYDGEFPDRSFSRFELFISRRSNLDSLELKLNPHFKNKDINPLINIAVMRSLRVLRIDMLYSCFAFPKSFYILSQLETLILEKLSLVDVPLPSDHLRIKSLHLLSVKFSGDESVKTLLSICPCLEDLVVKRSSYTNVMIFTIDVPTLMSLSIDNSSGKSRPEGVHGFVINTPSLRWFIIKDSFSNYLRFENMPELVKASVNVVYDQPEKFLGSLASTQYLSLCCVTSKLQTPYPPTATSFLFLEHLELCSCSVEWWYLLTRLLKNSPRVRVLKLKLYGKHCVQCNNNPWYKPDSVPECISSLHLKIFEWRQYKGTYQEKEVAKYILANASCLKEAKFFSDSAEKHGMFKELECVARGSKTCQLLFE